MNGSVAVAGNIYSRLKKELGNEEGRKKEEEEEIAILRGKKEKK